MNSIDKARQIVISYVQALNMDVGEQMAELFLVKTDDSRLLEHVEQIIVIMEEARKELSKAVYVREPYMEDISKEGLIVEIAKKYGIK
jgi:hypothetical protein